MPPILLEKYLAAAGTILIPGVLPGNFDAVAYCPTCDAGRGHRQLRLASSGARA